MELSLKITRPPHLPREFRGYSLNAAGRLEASCPGLLLKILHANSLLRQSFFLFAAAVDLDQPQVFLGQLAERAPDVLVGLEHLDPHAQIARALILMKPRRTIEALFGSCPDGFLGLLARLGGDPQYGKETYRNAFELFAKPEHRKRAKVLGQLSGRITAEHIAVVAGLDDVLVHHAVVRRARFREVATLNTFAGMLADQCAATPEAIKESLDALPVAAESGRMNEWVQGWLSRQVSLPIDPPIPATDPDLKLRLGAELSSLGRRLRNCAGQRQSFSFLGDRLIYEWVRPGETAVLELLRLTSGGETKWVCENLLGRANRRVSPELAASVRSKLDEHGILYQSLTRPSVEQQAMHKLLHHTIPFAWDVLPDAGGEENDDAGISRLLDELEQEVHGQEAA